MQARDNVQDTSVVIGTAAQSADLKGSSVATFILVPSGVGADTVTFEESTDDSAWTSVPADRLIAKFGTPAVNPVTTVASTAMTVGYLRSDNFRYVRMSGVSDGEAIILLSALRRHGAQH